MAGWTIGLMSGTSLDGVDAVLVAASRSIAADSSAPASTAASAVASTSLRMPEALRTELLALNRPGPDELHRAALAANAISELYATAVRLLLDKAGVDAADVAAIGAHGQTVRHRPGEFDGTGYTVQLINASLLAERTGIAVICDFRSRDVAAGGQGAPLVPAFHAACFGVAGSDVAVLNIGGIANLTLLAADGAVSGFDCGPGNVLMDGWCRRHIDADYDDDGRWAAGGVVDAALLQRLLAEPYLDRAPPKSTGRDLFDAAWLDQRLSGDADPRDVMATLCELTATAAAQALARHAPRTVKLLVCGGGAFNADLMGRLRRLLPGVDVQSTTTAGVPPDQVEALAFAWLADAWLARRAGNVPAVTGAAGPRVLGALYPAR